MFTGGIRFFRRIAWSVARSNASLLAAIAWVTAVAATAGASHQIYNVLSDIRMNGQVASDLQGLPKLVIKKEPLSLQEYNLIAEQLVGTFRNARFDVVNNSLEIRIANINDYDDFREIVRAVMHSKQGVRWSASKVCAGSGITCPASYYVAMQGYKLNFNLERGRAK